MPQTVVVLGARNLVGAIIDHFLVLGETRPAWLGARKRSTAFAPPEPSRSKPTQGDPPTLASATEHARRELESLDAVVNAVSASRPFATEEDMTAGATAFNAMDASETPGTRTSVDMCEIKLEQEPS